jgi:hypothetical protein
MTFAIVAFLLVLALDFLAKILDSPNEQPLPPIELPQLQDAQPQPKKDFETMLLEYESETETVTWEVTKNKS